MLRNLIQNDVVMTTLPLMSINKEFPRYGYYGRISVKVKKKKLSTFFFFELHDTFITIYINTRLLLIFYNQITIRICLN